MKTITASGLQPLLDKVTLIHVLPDDHFESSHIPGSINACVFEVSFVTRIQELVPEKDTAIVVYGAGAASHDAATAAEKLTKVGYTDVTAFTGGLEEWHEHGFPTEGSGAEFPIVQPNGVYEVDSETSLLRWTGRNLFNHHHGTMRLLGGRIEIEHGTLRSAHFTIDMNSILSEDLTDPGYHAMLIHHLRDDDFFAVDRFPTASFVCDHAEAIPLSTEGTPNYILRGALTLRGVTQPLVFQTVIADSDSDHLTGQAQFEIDRTQFGSHYGSGKWFSFLGKHVVNDHIHLHLKIHAKRI